MPRGLWGAGGQPGVPTARLAGENPSAFTSMTDSEHGTSPCPWWHTGLSKGPAKAHPWLDSQIAAQELPGEGAEVPVSPFPASPSQGGILLTLPLLCSPRALQQSSSGTAQQPWDQKCCKGGFVNHTNSSQGASSFLLLCSLSAIWQGPVRAGAEGCSWHWESSVCAEPSSAPGQDNAAGEQSTQMFCSKQDQAFC